MNRPLKNLLRITGIVLGLGAAAWALRHRLLPSPAVSDEPPPRFRTGPAEPEGTNLTSVKGIGPAFAARLEDAGVDSIAALAGADAAALAERTGLATGTLAGWIEQASNLA